MKKAITLDSIMVILFSAIGYGLGNAIPMSLGYGALISFIICMIAGMVLDSIGNKIIFNRRVQENPKLKMGVYAIIFASLVVGFILSSRLVEYSFVSDEMTQLLYAVAPIILGVIISTIIEAYKARKLVKKYGDGSGGFIYSEKEIEAMKKLNGDNEEITGRYDEKYSAKAVNGIFVGKKSGTCIKWLGIPYAKPPIGERRWKKPEAVDASNKVYSAYYFGPTEVQPENKHSILNYHKQSEDCLYLNIWGHKALEGEPKYPVMVYFHGGDGRYGGAAHPQYHFDELSSANPNAVYVSVNYRFGLFGVVDFSEKFDDESLKDAKALTLHDQIMALKWIHENIAAFGGDASNVTLIGDSAGASCACMLAATDSAQGLFNKVITITGSIMDVPITGNEAKQLGNKIVEELNIKSVNDLYNISTEDLRNISEKYYLLEELPPRNNGLTPTNFEDAYKKGVAKKISFIFGIAADELNAWQAMLAGGIDTVTLADEYFSRIKLLSKDKSALLEKIVEKHVNEGMSESDAKKLVLTNFQYKASVIKTCRDLVDGGSNVYCFYWDVKSNVENLKSNTIAIVTAIMGNGDIGEAMGYINATVNTEVMQTMIKKFMNGEELSLFNNEIRGVDAIDWRPYTRQNENILHVTSDMILCSDDISDSDVEEIIEIIFDK